MMNLFKLMPMPGLQRRLWHRHVRRKFGACGERVIVSMSGSYTWSTIFLGNDVHIGTRSILWAVNSRIVIGNKVLMAPEVIIMSGDHNTQLAGKFMYDYRDDENRPSDDRDVILEDDIWVGVRAVILKGVKVGRGAVIGAGAVVTKPVPPYCVVAGNPARPLKLRGSVEEILAHERSLYPPEARLNREAIEKAAMQLESARRQRSS
jgi:acetyltransferase-like isoleucine patch superfamily enzyme